MRPKPRVATAKLNLDFTEVRSPIAGRVGRALLTLGNLVQADQTLLTTRGLAGPDLCLLPAGRAVLSCATRELARKGERANSDNPVRVGLANETGYPHAGTVDFVDNQVDAATGTIRARAVLPILTACSRPACLRACSSKGSAEYMPC